MNQEYFLDFLRLVQSGKPQAVYDFISSCDEDKLKRLMKHMYRTNNKNRYFDDSTVLHHAAIWGVPEIVSILVEAGAILDGKDFNGKTSLALASACGLIEIVRTLVKAGADLDITDDWCRSALILALDNKHLDVAEFLVESGARVNDAMEYSGDQETIDWLRLAKRQKVDHGFDMMDEN